MNHRVKKWISLLRPDPVSRHPHDKRNTSSGTDVQARPSSQSIVYLVVPSLTVVKDMRIDINMYVYQPLAESFNFPS